MSEASDPDFKPIDFDPQNKSIPPPGHAATEGFGIRHDALLPTLIDRLTTPGTKGMIGIQTVDERSVALDFTVNSEGIMRGKIIDPDAERPKTNILTGETPEVDDKNDDGFIITFSPNPTEPIADILREKTPQETKNEPDKNSKWLKIGAVTISAIILGISGARILTSHKRNK
ncbi:MAG TPA: hypothetical protein VMQ58_02490 [Candidatus Saccharimonadales bacterium]|jgi:hypothetical protein|nr:hypothetical protein [Candidatus Saccharimonadales bacterium]